MHLNVNGENSQMSFEGKNFIEIGKWTEDSEKWMPGTGLPPSRGNIHV